MAEGLILLTGSSSDGEASGGHSRARRRRQLKRKRRRRCPAAPAASEVIDLTGDDPVGKTALSRDFGVIDLTQTEDTMVSPLHNGGYVSLDLIHSTPASLQPVYSPQILTTLNTERTLNMPLGLWDRKQPSPKEDAVHPACFQGSFALVPSFSGDSESSSYTTYNSDLGSLGSPQLASDVFSISSASDSGEHETFQEPVEHDSNSCPPEGELNPQLSLPDQRHSPSSLFSQCPLNPSTFPTEGDQLMVVSNDSTSGAVTPDAQEPAQQTDIKVWMKTQQHFPEVPVQPSSCPPEGELNPQLCLPDQRHSPSSLFPQCPPNPSTFPTEGDQLMVVSNDSTSGDVTPDAQEPAQQTDLKVWMKTLQHFPEVPVQPSSCPPEGELNPQLCLPDQRHSPSSLFPQCPPNPSTFPTEGDQLMVVSNDSTSGDVTPDAQEPAQQTDIKVWMKTQQHFPEVPVQPSSCPPEGELNPQLCLPDQRHSPSSLFPQCPPNPSTFPTEGDQLMVVSNDSTSGAVTPDAQEPAQQTDLKVWMKTLQHFPEVPVHPSSCPPEGELNPQLCLPDQRHSPSSLFPQCPPNPSTFPTEGDQLMVVSNDSTSGDVTPDAQEPAQQTDIKVWMKTLQYFPGVPVHHPFLHNIVHEKDARQNKRQKAQPIPSCRLSMVSSTIEENFFRGTLDFLMDYVSSQYYPSKETMQDVVRQILLSSEVQQEIQRDAYMLLMKIQALHPAKADTVVWDWDLLREVMTEQEEKFPGRLLFLNYVIQTLEDDFQTMARQGILHKSIAKKMLSCDQCFSNVKELIDWLVAAVTGTRFPQHRDLQEAGPSLETSVAKNSISVPKLHLATTTQTGDLSLPFQSQREVALLQRMLSIAVEVDKSPNCSVNKIADMIFLSVLNIPKRIQREAFLSSMECHLLRCKVLELIFLHSCNKSSCNSPVNLPLSIAKILCFLKHPSPPIKYQDNETTWQRWDEMLHQLNLLVLSYHRVILGHLRSSVCERINLIIKAAKPKLQSHDSITILDANISINSFQKQLLQTLGQPLPSPIKEKIALLQILFHTTTDIYRTFGQLDGPPGCGSN